MDRIEQLLSDLRVEVAESRVHLEHIVEHLSKLNNKAQKHEEKISSLESQATQAKAIWKTVAAISSTVGASLSWLYSVLIKQ